MDASDMYFLARRLLAAARATIAPAADIDRLSGAEQLALQDIVESAPTSVQEIARRTRIAQSRVSGIVAKWRERGALDVEADPHDRRRSIISPSAALRESHLSGAAASAEAVLDELGVALSPGERQAVLANLELLLARLRAQGA